MGASSGGVGCDEGLGTAVAVEMGVVEVVGEGNEASVREVTVVTEDSSMEGSSRVGAGEGLRGGTGSGLLFILSEASGVSDTLGVGVEISSEVSVSGITAPITLLLVLSLEPADVGEEEGVVRGDEGVVDSDVEIVDAGVDNVEGRDVVVGSDDVGVGGDDDGVGECEECVMEVVKAEVGVVSMGLREDEGDEVSVVEGIMM